MEYRGYVNPLMRRIFAAGVAGTGTYFLLSGLEADSSVDLIDPATFESLGNYVLRDLRNFFISGAAAVVAGVSVYFIEDGQEESNSSRTSTSDDISRFFPSV